MIDSDQVKHIANLARIGLNEGEAEKFQKSLGSILDYVKKLNEVDVSGIEPIANIMGLENSFRKDDADPAMIRGAHPDPAILKDMAPDKEGGYVKVKQILNKN